ncbi:MAG: pilin [Thiohalocapsa sp.]|nr:pilin [Thiohalocapsa sp.]
MKKQQAGFTLIELMIVVAIIGILAAIAIPSYQDYTKKARVSELILMTAPYKLGVSESISDGKPTSVMNSAASVGAPDFVATSIVSSIAIAAGEITASADTTLVGDIQIVLTPDDTTSGIIWECTSTGADNRLAPSSCR